MPVSIIDFVRDLISDDKQIEGELAVLTVGRIGRITVPGALDFGGSEYRAASVAWLEPEKQSPDDKYGWWKLEGGSYLVELNETIVPHDAHPVVLQTWPAAMEAGVWHETVMISSTSEKPTLSLQVPQVGVAIKENSRITAAIPILTLTV